jgi:hypothetical protein
MAHVRRYRFANNIGRLCSPENLNHDSTSSAPTVQLHASLVHHTRKNSIHFELKGQHNPQKTLDSLMQFQTLFQRTNPFRETQISGAGYGNREPLFQTKLTSSATAQTPQPRSSPTSPQKEALDPSKSLSHQKIRLLRQLPEEPLRKHSKTPT